MSDKQIQIEAGGFKATVNFHLQANHEVVAIVTCQGVLKTVYVLRKGGDNPTQGILNGLRGGGTINFNMVFTTALFKACPEGVA